MGGSLLDIDIRLIMLLLYAEVVWRMLDVSIWFVRLVNITFYGVSEWKSMSRHVDLCIHIFK